MPPQMSDAPPVQGDSAPVSRDQDAEHAHNDQHGSHGSDHGSEAGERELAHAVRRDGHNSSSSSSSSGGVADGGPEESCVRCRRPERTLRACVLRLRVDERHRLLRWKAARPALPTHAAGAKTAAYVSLKRIKALARRG